jgi:hypothetical protein
MDLIVNGSNGMYWYPKGSERLAKSLDAVGWTDYKIYNNYPDSVFDRSCPYTIKPEIISFVVNEIRPTRILWVDCSVWAMRNPKPIFDIINKDGYYFWSSGYNAAQTCSDKCLEYFGIDRDKAETYEDCSTSIFGVDLSNEVGAKFIINWVQSAIDGAFHGSRLHDNQSQDHRFLFHRQDQSAATCLIGEMGLKIHKPKEHCMYDTDGEAPESVIFKMRGM